MSASAGQARQFVSYAEFGEQFFVRAVTPERVAGIVNSLAGQPIDFGPTGVGPGRLVKVKATGTIGAASIEDAHDEGTLGYRLTLPVTLAFEVDLGLETQRFKAGLLVPVLLRARAVDDVRIFIDAVPPKPREVVIDLQAQGLRASVLQRVAGVDGEVRRFVSKYVARELTKPHLLDARTIDVGAIIDATFARLAPSSPSEAAHVISEDLNEALNEENWEGPEGETVP